MHKQVVSFILLLIIVFSSAKSVHKGRKDEENKEQYNTADFDVIYDQKQNGSENYRLNVKGVDVIIAPPSSMLQAILSPLSVLALLEGFSKKSALPMLKKNFGSGREGNSKIDNVIDVTTTSNSTSAYTNDVVKDQKAPLRDFTKNFEEKIQVQELLPGFKDEIEKKEMKEKNNSAMESTNQPEVV